MKIPVVITEKEYRKGKPAFDEAEDRYGWVVTAQSESDVAAAVSKSGAKIAVLGVEKYKGPLYEALAGNAAGAKALIARYGVGYDGVDMGECARHGIVLTITPGALDRSVAEHAMALMLGFARNLVFGDSEMRSGRFSPRTGFELAGKKLLIAGFGNIGKQLARMAAFGFGMSVSAYDALSLDVLASREGLGSAEFMQRHGLADCSRDFDQLAGAADIFSMHMPVLPATLKFMDAARFARLKEGAVFVNTSRGKLVDESDLYDALSSGRLRGAALDVFEKEPYEPARPDKDLRSLGNVILTPHTASDTKEANENMRALVLCNIDAFCSGAFEKLTAVNRT